MADVCKNCGETLKIAMLSSNQPLPKASVNIINLISAELQITACNKCGDEPLKAAKLSLNEEAKTLRTQLKQSLAHVPVLSLQHPQGWVYEPITIVTAQTVTGTGIFSDVASAFTDLFGTQSGTYNAKLRDGENLCKAQLRGQALELGGNAVIAVDVDYAEVGGQRAMLMVCMTGTAIKITSLDTSDDSFFAITANATMMARRVRVIDDALKAPIY